MRVLIVEDDPSVARALTQDLRRDIYAVDLATTCDDADARARAVDYDLILLDPSTDGGAGLELLRRWRRRGLDTPVLLHCACDDADAKVAGLDAGADDYLARPFAREELLARVRCLLRRRRPHPDRGSRGHTR